MICKECEIEFEEDDIYYEDNSNSYCEECFKEYVEDNFEDIFEKNIYSSKADYENSQTDEMRGK